MGDAAENIPTRAMTADEFLAWAETYGGDGVFELHDGHIVAKYTAMAPEALPHVELKFALALGLRDAIRNAELPCRAFIEGLAVRVSPNRSFIPDAIVYCGEELPRSTREINDPIIVVEVLSPSTARYDLNAKLEGYFLVPSILHYLIVDPDRPLVIHYARQTDGSLRTTLTPSGTLRLEPPGIDLDLDAVFSGA
jgi:Uma2 family endonuclease